MPDVTWFTHLLKRIGPRGARYTMCGARWGEVCNPADLTERHRVCRECIDAAVADDA